MMSVNELDYATATRGSERAEAWRHWIGVIAAAADLAVVFGTVALAALAETLLAGPPGVDWHRVAQLSAMIGAIFVFTNLLRGRYQIANHLSIRGQVGQAFTVWNVAMVAFITLAFATGLVDRYSRTLVIATYLSGIPLVALARCALVRAISLASKTGRITAERVFLIGREAEVMSFAARHQPWNLGFVIVDVAFLRDAGAPRAADPAAALAADLATAIARCRAMRPDSVFIALPWAERDRIDACIDAFMTLPVAIHLAPERIMDRFASPHIVRIGSLASLRLTRPALSALEIAAKRVFDCTLASLILVATLPLLIVIAALIKRDSKGPVLFLQRRHGFNQRAFRIVKFRTMTTADDGPVVPQAKPDDPRVTRIGRVLRRYNLDELPQLLNVIAGQMSLVGPRPHALAHDHEFQRKIALYARRHNVKPGITGWAQVHGLRGETDTVDKMARRVAHDHWYIDNWSFGLDLAILARTILSPTSYVNAR